jgi:hypothetical protein
VAQFAARRVYALVVAKGGAKFTETQEPAPAGDAAAPNRDHQPVQRRCSGSVRRCGPAAEDDPFGRRGAIALGGELLNLARATGASDPGRSIFTAIQSLGLKLEPRKAPLLMIVVDKAEKMPTDI